MSSLGARWGPKRMLLSGFTVFGVASALVVFADNAIEVIAVRALLGVGGAMIMSTTLSLLRSSSTDPRERATALGTWAAVPGLGAAAGPIVGGVLLEHFSWRAAFLVNVPLMVIAPLAAGDHPARLSRHRQPGLWDWVAAATSLTGIIALVWAIKQFAKQSTLPGPWIALAIAVVLLAAFVVRNLRRRDPLLDVQLFRDRAFSAGILAALGSVLGPAAALLLLAQWLQLVENLSPVQAGIRLVPIALAATVFSMLAAPLARAVGARLVLAGGIAVAAQVCCCFSTKAGCPTSRSSSVRFSSAPGSAPWRSPRR